MSGPLAVPARLGEAAWRILTSVRFAVLLIILIAVAGLVGTLVRQFSLRALDDPTTWVAELGEMRERWDGLTFLGLPLGTLLVDAFDVLGFFRVFSTPWFLLLLVLLTLSIICCTLDRLPRLWREARRVRVEQPESFFDPRLGGRARLEAPGRAWVADTRLEGSVASILRARRFTVRRAASPDGTVTWLYGDRNRYSKLATLLTHAGLVLFLLGGGVTVSLGYETVLFVADGQSAPVQPVGTPGNLLVRNMGFEAPRRPDGSFADFRTDLAVYRDGALLARKVIRVNDPLEVGGFTFHQNTFGPGAELVIRDEAGELAWSGPVILAGEVAGLPQGFLTVPGSRLGLLILLGLDAGQEPELIIRGVTASQVGDEGRSAFLGALPLGGSSTPGQTGGFAITWSGLTSWSGMVVKRDPGQPVIWLAFGLLLVGLVVTFHLPRRRVWVRLDAKGMSLAQLAERGAEVDDELERLLRDVKDGVIADASFQSGSHSDR